VTRPIYTSVFDSLPSVTFSNTSLGGDRSIWVFENVTDAERAADKLRKMSHIVDVEVLNAQVKRSGDV